MCLVTFFFPLGVLTQELNTAAQSGLEFIRKRGGWGAGSEPAGLLLF